MAVTDTNINSLRSLVFVRKHGEQAIGNTGLRADVKSDLSELTDDRQKVSPKKISFNVNNNKITVQKNKTSQDRFIDFYA